MPLLPTFRAGSPGNDPELKRTLIGICGPNSKGLQPNGDGLQPLKIYIVFCDLCFNMCSSFQCNYPATKRLVLEKESESIGSGGCGGSLQWVEEDICMEFWNSTATVACSSGVGGGRLMRALPEKSGQYNASFYKSPSLSQCTSA